MESPAKTSYDSTNLRILEPKPIDLGPVEKEDHQGLKFCDVCGRFILDYQEYLDHWNNHDEEDRKKAIINLRDYKETLLNGSQLVFGN